MKKYKARPATAEFEGMCMVDFASKYRIVYGRYKHGENVILLQNEMGFIQKRSKGKDAVITYARFLEKKDPEKYYGMLLKVFVPFRSECQFNIPPFNSYQCFYSNAGISMTGSESVTPACKIVKDNRSRYEMESDAVEHAIEDFAEIGPFEDAWANFVPSSELLRVEALSEL